MSPDTVDEHSAVEELIGLCANPPKDCIVGGTTYGNKVIKISPLTVIKYGFGVTEAEAINQSKVFDMADPQRVRIPKVHRFFSDSEGRGYIVMEFKSGKIIEPLEDPTKIAAVARILDHIGSFRSEIPGPLHFGSPSGLLFHDEADYSFTDAKDMEEWWNRRLLPEDPSFCIKGFKFVLCHLDVAPRNILWEDDEPPCLLDWASAGYYPRFFEFCAQRAIEGKEGRFNTLLLETMTQLDKNESSQIGAVLRAWSNMQRYYFPRARKPQNSNIDQDRRSSVDQHMGKSGPPLPPYPDGWLDEMLQMGKRWVAEQSTL